MESYDDMDLDLFWDDDFMMNLGDPEGHLPFDSNEDVFVKSEASSPELDEMELEEQDEELESDSR